MAVMGADRTPICDRIADGRHPGPAVEVAFLPDVHNKQAVCPTSSLDNPGQSVADHRADTNQGDGLSSLDVGQSGQRATDACDGLEMGARAADAPPPPGGAGERATGGPSRHIPTHPADFTDFQFSAPGWIRPPGADAAWFVGPPTAGPCSLFALATFPMTAQSRPAAPMALRLSAPPLPARLVRSLPVGDW